MARSVLVCLVVSLLVLTDAHQELSAVKCGHLEVQKIACDKDKNNWCSKNEVAKFCQNEESDKCKTKKGECKKEKQKCQEYDNDLILKCAQDTEVKIAFWRPGNGTWMIKGPGRGNYEDSRFNIEIKNGKKGDIPVPRDYFHEGADRLAIFSPVLGHWHIKGQGYKDYNASKGNIDIHFGGIGDLPVPGDYSGDGVMSLAVFSTTTGMWYIKGPGLAHWGDNDGDIGIQCGKAGDIPVPMDYFGQGRMNIAVFRPKNGMWYIKGPNMVNWALDSDDKSIQCGQNGDIPVPGNYYGDGTVRLAVFTPKTGMWTIKENSLNDLDQSSINVKVQCGQEGDVPVPYDFFGEGKVRIAVWRPSEGNWYIKAPGFGHWTGEGRDIIIHAGEQGDVPIKISRFMI